MTEPLPDFESFKYQIVCPPSIPKLEAWKKFQECERRLEMYRYAERLNDPSTPRYQVFLDDCASALLLSLEATFGFIQDQLEKASRVPTPSFNSWLRNNSGIELKGLRTLRHFAAHVHIKRLPSDINAVICESLGDGTSAIEVSRSWRLPQILTADLSLLKKNAPLDSTEVSHWNNVVSKDAAGSIFMIGLEQVQKILLLAEEII